jgi:hypothetical protein
MKALKAQARGSLVLLLVAVAGACAHPQRAGEVSRPVVGDGVVMVTKDGHCLELLPENQLHRVRGCETAKTYEIEIAGRRQIVDKRAFREQLRERIVQFLRPTGYRWRELEAADVELWLTAPVFKPEDTTLVAVVLCPAGNFAMRLPVDPGLWNPGVEDVLVLGSRRYPSKSAVQAGVVVVEASAVSSKEETLAYLTRMEAKGVEADQWPLLKLRTTPFAEADVARRIATTWRGRSFVDRAKTLPAGEVEAARGLAFRFAFKPKKRLWKKS